MDERLDDFYHNIFDKYLTISMSDVFDKATCFDVVHDIRKYLDICYPSVLQDKDRRDIFRRWLIHNVYTRDYRYERDLKYVTSRISYWSDVDVELLLDLLDKKPVIIRGHEYDLTNMSDFNNQYLAKAVIENLLIGIRYFVSHPVCLI